MKKFENILVFTGTEENQVALDRAYEIAAENEARVTLMDVVKPLPKAIGSLTDVATPEELTDLLVNDRRGKLEAIAKAHAHVPVQVQMVVASGDAVEQICRRVIGEGHDLVLKAGNVNPEGTNMFGSVGKSLLRNCPCPVWVLKPGLHGAFDRVLAAVDVDAADEPHQKLNREIIDLAGSVAIRDKAELHLVCAWDLWMEQALRRRAGNDEINATLEKQEATARKALEKLLDRPELKDVDVHVHVHRGNAAAVIEGVAEKIEADLLVMGTVCRGGVAGFLIGNTAETLLTHVSCSVLATKPEGFQSPFETENVEESVRSPGAVYVF